MSWQEVFYEFRAKEIERIEEVKRLADQIAAEIKSVGGWDIEVHISLEPESKSKKLFSVAIGVYGLRDPITVRKSGREVTTLLGEVKRAVLRRMQKSSERRVSIRRKQMARHRAAA